MLRIHASAITLTLSVLALIISSSASAGESSRLQAGDVKVLSDVFFIMQGENDITPGSESSDDFYVLQIADFELPDDEQKVYMNIPRDARDINVWQAGTPLNESDYDWEQVDGTEVFVINVPSSFQRTGEFTNITDSQPEFSASGSEFTNTSFLSGALRLSANATSGQYVSPEIPVAAAHIVDAANMTVMGTELGNVTMEISNDGGASWVACSNAETVDFASDGSVLRYRLSFAGNASVASVEMDAHYVMSFTVHVSYLWTGHFSHGKVTIDVTSIHELDDDATCHMILYVLKGYTASGIGFNLTSDQSDPTSDLYMNASFRPGPDSGMAVEIHAPEDDWSILVYGIGAAIAASLAGVALYFRFSSKKARATAVSHAPSDESIARVQMSSAEIDARRKELVLRKKDLLSKVEDVEARASEGKLSRAEADAQVAKLKTELKATRNELNRLSRWSESAGVTETGDSDEYQAVLAAISRIDEDFEKGRLPEATHARLRKEYVEKAKKMLSARDANERAGTRPADIEKAKLMEAIATLDEEHERGEVDDKLYNDLRSSYKKQLAEIMMRSDGSKEAGDE